MKFCVVNKSTILNRFVLHTLQCTITHLAVITRKTNKKTRYFERGELDKSQKILCKLSGHTISHLNELNIQ